MNIIPFNFESKEIRVVEINGEPWFVAKDVAEGLGYVWKGSATISHIPDEWRGVYSVQTPSGMQEMSCLTEQGLYFFVNRSDKPKAIPFQKWVAGAVRLFELYTKGKLPMKKTWNGLFTHDKSVEIAA